jgi:hypothetical protein
VQTKIQIGHRLFDLASLDDMAEAVRILAGSVSEERVAESVCSLEERVAIALVMAHYKLARRGTGSDYVVSAREMTNEAKALGPWASSAVDAIACGAPLSMFAETISLILGARIETFGGGDGDLRLRVRLF